MKRCLLSCCALLAAYTLIAQPNLSRLEYFFDADPGFGLGTPVPTPASPDVVDFTLSVPTGALSNGFHWLYVRAMDINGKWSETQRMVVLKQDAASTAPPPNLGAITRLFPLVDSDPATGIMTSRRAAASLCSRSASRLSSRLSTGLPA